MPAINSRGLRDARRPKEWLRAGKTLELRERDHVIARIVPEDYARQTRQWPDFAARRKKIFGGRVLPRADLLMGERDRGRYEAPMPIRDLRHRTAYSPGRAAEAALTIERSPGEVPEDKKNGGLLNDASQEPVGALTVWLALCSFILFFIS